MKQPVSQLSTFFLLCISSLYAAEGKSPPSLQASISHEPLKEKIAKNLALLKESESPSDKSLIFYRLACDYYQDQELDKAFLSFLESLKGVSRNVPPPLMEEEKKIYEEALAIYLSLASNDPVKAGQELIEKYRSIGEAHPDYAHLNFLLSAAFANVGNYSLFFERFYNGYAKLWDTFLAYKTQGILYLRLSQKCSMQEQRRLYLKEAENLLVIALKKNGQDPGLYRILISFAKEEKNDSLVLSYMQQMVRAAAPLPRGDIFLYVREAVSLEEYELAQEMIDHARQQYATSRVIAAAQDYLDQHKNG